MKTKRPESPRVARLRQRRRETRQWLADTQYVDGDALLDDALRKHGAIGGNLNVWSEEAYERALAEHFAAVRNG